MKTIIMGILFLSILIIFLIIKKLRKAMKSLDANLTNVGVEMARQLNTFGYNIKTSQGFNINGKKIISFNQYFNTGWDSGIQLNFNINSNNLKFKNYGAFGFRNKIYDTQENNDVLKKLIIDIEKLEI